MMRTNELHALTDEQRAVVDMPINARSLILAGPGTGKTHTLLNRVEALAYREDLAADEVLMLTFSRATVRELRSRLTHRSGGARFVQAQTFDAWALELLIDIEPDVEWRERSFDDRITAAADVVARGDADDRYQDVLRHVVIDEVQDLVGARRELVEVFLDRAADDPEFGFTIVGDPAQAIYGFQISDPVQRANETHLFFDWLNSTFNGDLTVLRLSENFRARTEETRAALPYGAKLQGRLTPDEARTLYRDLRARISDMEYFGSLGDTFVRESLVFTDGSTAVLCRDNGQALRASALLHESGIEHHLQRSFRDRPVPRWVSALVRNCESPRLPRSLFDELADSLPDAAAESPESRWTLLVRAAGIRGGHSVDLRRLRERVATGGIPDEFMDQPPASILVSSFHRAKGLEFDRVLIVDPTMPDKISAWGSSPSPRETDVEEEARALYVAMTRARGELYRTDLPGMGLPIRREPTTKRWALYGWPRQHWRRPGLELLSIDVHYEHPAGTYGFSSSPRELQERLERDVRPGDPVTLRRIDDLPTEAGRSPLYRVEHRLGVIGVVSERFQSDLYRYMKQSRTFVPRNWPEEIEGAYVESVETVAGDRSSGLDAGLGEHGVWSVPRLTGLTRFIYTKASGGRTHAG